MAGVIRYAHLMVNKYRVKLNKEWIKSDNELVDCVIIEFEGGKSNLSNVKNFQNFEVVCVCVEILVEVRPSIQLYNMVCRILKQNSSQFISRFFVVAFKLID